MAAGAFAEGDFGLSFVERVLPDQFVQDGPAGKPYRLPPHFEKIAEQVRLPLCGSYGTCVGKVAKKGWESWSCHRCPKANVALSVPGLVKVLSMPCQECGTQEPVQMMKFRIKRFCSCCRLSSPAKYDACECGGLKTVCNKRCEECYFKFRREQAMKNRVMIVCLWPDCTRARFVTPANASSGRGFFCSHSCSSRYTRRRYARAL